MTTNINGNLLAPEGVGVGFSHQTLLTASVVGFLGVAAVVYSLIVSRVKSNLDDDDDDEDAEYEAKLARADVAHLNRAQRRARAHFLMKQQRKAPSNNVPNEVDNNNEDNHPDLPPEELPIALPRKERQKAAKAAEREERQRFQKERQQQQEQAQKEAALERVRRQELAAISAAEAKRIQQVEIELQQQKEEAMKQIFMSCPNKSLTLDEWRTSLQKTRRVDLAALGAEFGTSSQAVYQRIQQLLVERRVTGILESKQFIALSEDELQRIADQIREKGAVTLQDVVTLCLPIIAS